MSERNKYARTVRYLLEEVIFEETDYGLRGRATREVARLFAAAKLTVEELGGAKLPPGFSQSVRVHAWWSAAGGGYVFVPRSEEGLPPYSTLQRLPGNGRTVPTTQAATPPLHPQPPVSQHRDRTPTDGRFTECGHCGAPLTDAESRNVGFGPESRRSYSVKELRRMGTHREASQTRDWVEDVTLDELLVDGRDRWP